MAPRLPLVCALTAVVTVAAQTPRSFEAASVRPNRTGELMIRTDTEPGGRFIAVNATLRMLIQLAYGLDDFEIVGAPDWAASDRFDVNAAAGQELAPLEGPTRGSPVLQDMLRALLRDRFALASHTDTGERDALALTLSRADRRPGPRLTSSTIDCAALRAATKPDAGAPACGFRMAPGSIVLEGVPVSQLATSLSGLFGRRVIDRTGLTGNFDLQLAWDMPVPGGAARADAVSLTTALGDQAGLRLTPTRAPSTVLVIDSVRQPSDN